MRCGRLREGVISERSEKGGAKSCKAWKKRKEMGKEKHRKDKIRRGWEKVLNEGGRGSRGGCGV